MEILFLFLFISLSRSLTCIHTYTHTHTGCTEHSERGICPFTLNFFPKNTIQMRMRFAWREDGDGVSVYVCA